MIIDYDRRYSKDVKDLLLELQEHIASLDKEGYNIVTPSYREKYFRKTMQDIKEKNGKMLLYEEDGKIVGLIIGVILPPVDRYDFRTPKRGRITELVVTKNCRSHGCGKELLSAMEKHLISEGCKNIMIAVFGYNDGAISFYEKNGYRPRLIDMTKNV